MRAGIMAVRDAENPCVGITKRDVTARANGWLTAQCRAPRDRTVTGNIVRDPVRCPSHVAGPLGSR